MRRSHTILALASTILLAGSVTSPALASGSGRDAAHHHQSRPFTFAVIGDVPYGTAAEAHFPDFIEGINADPDVTQVTHLGDIKSGSTTCTDERFQAVRTNFDLFEDPLYYTPGDNEWTDCHRANNGAFQPLERLAKVRSLFFTPAGRTQGHQVRVATQARLGFPENFRWNRGNVSFATIHVVGSNNDLAPWTGIGQTTATPQQVDEQKRRMAAAIANVRATYADARKHHRRTVVIQQQADMFDPTVTDPQTSDYSAFTPLVQALVDESRRFHGVSYLFNGDSHRFNEDRPVAKGSPWLSFYGVKGSSDGLHRITVDGSDLGEADWLKVTVHRLGPAPLTFEQVPGQ
jgi:hypothetical protein